jgi:hypothetical protein
VSKLRNFGGGGVSTPPTPAVRHCPAVTLHSLSPHTTITNLHTLLSLSYSCQSMTVLLLQVFLPQWENQNVSRHCQNFIIVTTWEHPRHLASRTELCVIPGKLSLNPIKPGQSRQENRDCPGRTSETNEIASRTYICSCALQTLNLGGAGHKVPYHQIFHLLLFLHST